MFSAERAWSQSASLKSDDAHPPKRHHVARRLTKAQRLAELLSSLVESCNADSQTRLQARAYKASIAGQAAFEKKQWQNALREYCVVKVILDVLVSKADESTQSVYKEGISGVDPSLRYSAYQSQVGSTGDMLSFAYNYVSKDTSLMDLLNDINPAIVEERQKGPTRAGITSIQWRSRTASLDFPEIAVSLLKVQDAQAAFTERTSTFDLAPHEKASAMDDVLNAWAEAEESVAKIIEEGAGRSQDKEQNLQIIRTYVGFHTISARVQRDLLLIKDLEKRQGNQITILKDLVRLHDSIIRVFNPVSSFLTIAEYSADLRFPWYTGRCSTSRRSRISTELFQSFSMYFTRPFTSTTKRLYFYTCTSRESGNIPEKYLSFIHFCHPFRHSHHQGRRRHPRCNAFQ